MKTHAPRPPTSRSLAPSSSSPLVHPLATWRTARATHMPASEAEAMESLPNERAIRAIAEAGISSPGSALPHQPALQPLFGRHRLANLRVHSDAQAVAAADRLGAQAYTYKGQIVLRPGASLHETAHESAHALLEQQGFAAQTAIARPQDPPERLAESVARGVSARQPVAPLLDAAITAGSLPRANPAGTVQRIIKYTFSLPDEGPAPQSIEDVDKLLKKKFSGVEYENWSATYRNKVRDMIASSDIFEYFFESEFVSCTKNNEYPEPKKSGQSPAPEEKAAPLSTNPYRKLLQKAVAPIVKTEFPAVNFDQILQGLPAVQWKADGQRGADNKFQFRSHPNSMNCYEFAFLFAHQCGYISNEDIEILEMDPNVERSVISQMISIIKQEAVPLKPDEYKTCNAGDIIFLNSPETHTGICTGSNNILELGSNTGGIRRTTIEQMRQGYLFCSSLEGVTQVDTLACALSVGADTDLDTAEMYYQLIGDNETIHNHSVWNNWTAVKDNIDKFITINRNNNAPNSDLINFIEKYNIRTNEINQVTEINNKTQPADQKIPKHPLMPAILQKALLELAHVKVCRAPRERWVGRIKAIVANQKHKANPHPS